MKSILITLIAMAIGINATGQQHIITYYDYLKKYKKEDYYLNSAGERTGRDIDYGEDGTILSIITFLHDKMNGKCTGYYDEMGHKSIKVTGSYKNDRQDGLWQYYYNEKWNLFYQKIILTEEFYKDGSLIWKKLYLPTSGDITSYDSKRYLCEEDTYSNNEIVGSKLYWENGKLYAENGKLLSDDKHDHKPVDNTPVVVTPPIIKPKPKLYPEPSLETRQNIDLIREGKYSDVSLEWIKWMTEHFDDLAPEDRLTPDDYIMYSRYKFRSEHGADAATVLAGALKEFPDNSALQSEYDKYKNPLYQIH